ncbi:MAG: methylamine utilization protein [Pseudomonadota bacterium]
MRYSPHAAALLCSVMATAALAADLSVTVSDASGSPIQGAVVMASAPGQAPEASAKAVSIDQMNREFVPFLSVVPVGTRIAFPNSDNIRHHVYSFSEAKRFEIPLYAGDATAPEILVDQAGVIALGCNVHDWMRAYVVVSDTPHTAQSDERGRVLLTVPAGEYTLRVWHPSVRDDEAGMSVPITVPDAGLEKSLSLADQPRWRAWRAPSAFEEDY